MNPKKSMFIFQIANLSRFYTEQGGLREFIQRHNPQKNQGTLSISFYSNKKGDIVTAFSALSYTHGFLDSGALIGIFDVHDSDLFIVD